MLCLLRFLVEDDASVPYAQDALSDFVFVWESHLMQFTASLIEVPSAVASLIGVCVS